MKNNIQEFEEIIKEIKSKGFLRTNRVGNTGIGKTLEDYCKIPENNHLTLFTKSPTFPRSANKFLRLNYGSFDTEYPEMKVLHTSVFANKFNTHISGYGFSASVDYKNEKIFLLVKKLCTNQIVAQDTYWSFASIKKKIEDKLNVLAYISAKTCIRDGYEYFHFDKATLLEGLSFNNFIALLEQGKVMIDLRVGVYKTGINAGKNHDHGTAFRVAKSDLKYFFNDIREI